MADEQRQVTAGAQPAREAPQGKMPEPAKPATGTDTVTVACKVPGGLIFDLCEMVDDYEPVMGGGQKKVKKAAPTGVRVVLAGPAREQQAMRRGLNGDGSTLAGGYALTSGVPREHWEKIERDYRDLPAFVNGLVFAQKSDVAAMSEARNRRELTTGMEGIDPENPGKRTGIRSITRAEKPAAAA